MIPHAPRKSPFAAHRMRGLALVETALALPILLLLWVTTLEVGRAFVQYSVLSHHVHASARYLAERALDGTTGVVNIDRVDPDAKAAGETTTIRELARRLLVFGSPCGGGSGCAGATEALPDLETATIDLEVLGIDVQARARYEYQPLLIGALPTWLGLSDAFHFDVRVRMRPL